MRPFLTLLILTLSLWSMCSANDYRLDVFLLSYRNPTNQRSGNTCCENDALSLCHDDFTCEKCDPSFTVSVIGSNSFTTDEYTDTDNITFSCYDFYQFDVNDTYWPYQNVTVDMKVKHGDYNIMKKSMNITLMPSEDYQTRQFLIIMSCGDGFVEVNISYKIQDVTKSSVTTVTEIITEPAVTTVTETITVCTGSTTNIWAVSATTNVLDRSCDYPLISTTTTMQPSDNSRGTPERKDMAGVVGAATTGGFLGGVILALVAFILFLLFIQIKKRKPRRSYFSRRQRNPFYQSAQDLMDAPRPVEQKQLQEDDNGGYDTLRVGQVPPWSGNLKKLKLFPLGKRENGFMYCLSPSDPPVPLRPVPTPILERKNKQSDSKQRPYSFSFGLSPKRKPKESPIYEMPDKFVKKNNCLLRSSSPQPPALPAGRENLLAVPKLKLNQDLDRRPNPPSSPRPQHLMLVHTMAQTEGYQTALCVRQSETKTNRENGDMKIELQNWDTMDEGRQVTTVSNETSSLYANVKKNPKRSSSPAVERHYINLCRDSDEEEDEEEERDSILSGTPPPIPPYTGEEIDWQSERKDGSPVTVGVNLERKASDDIKCPPSTPFI